ncbi:hypothetical protein ACA910_012883 [Epithemia clementina (nom. ined.)]
MKQFFAESAAAALSPLQLICGRFRFSRVTLASLLIVWFVALAAQLSLIFLQQKDFYNINSVTILEQSKTNQLHQKLQAQQGKVLQKDGDHSRIFNMSQDIVQSSLDFQRVQILPSKETATSRKKEEKQSNRTVSSSWLSGHRLGNVRDDNLTKAFRLFPRDQGSQNKNTVLSSLARETLCFNSSRWVQDTTDARLWTTRLVYFAAYWHQHVPAVKEFAASTMMNDENKRQQRALHDLGPFDFECSSARFLVVPLSGKGIGATFRLTAVSALKAAIATDRVAVFANKAVSTSTKASCSRQDFQCFFRPISPCALLENDAANAHVLRRTEIRQLFRLGILPQERTKDKVIRLNIANRPQRHPQNLRWKLYNISLKVIQHHPELRIEVVKQGLERLVKPLQNSSNNMFEGDQEISNGLMMYALRPLPNLLHQVDSIVDDVVLTQKVKPESSLGYPLRASDKCDVESECFSVDQYQLSVADMWQTSWATTENATRKEWSNISLIVTTEDQSLLDGFKNASETPLFRFVYNHYDVLQGSGWMAHIHDKYSLDQVMVSALSSLKLQLLPRFTLANCCSNFHVLLRDLLGEGCGAYHSSTFQCMQDHPNENHRLCCAWDKSKACKVKRMNRQNSTLLH